MIRNIVVIAILIICSIRTVSYAIFTWQNKNITGAVSIFFLVLMFWVVNIFFLV